MKVLITGGYGFIGSFVSERFYKEGYEVTIIDNLSSGAKENVPFKHKSYLLSVEDPKCEEVFRNNRFDAVIHLAAQPNVHTSIENPRLDAQSNVLGLANMLSLSKKHGAGKFIFASSAAVYGEPQQIPLPESAVCNPYSPYGINKWVGETYCSKWNEMYGLNTLCFRFSNVYGPRQGNGGEGGVISIFLQKAISGQKLTIHGDGSQSRDFIFVEDIAEAIYRASYSSLSGVYNLSTNSETSLNELIHEIQELHSPVETTFAERRQGDIHRSVLDNSRIIHELDWVPKYSLTEGLRKTYEWFMLQSQQAAAAERIAAAKPVRTQSKWMTALKPYLENGIAFLLAVWLTSIFNDDLYNFIDFGLLYIIVMGALYGSKQSIIAVIMSTALSAYQSIINGRELVSLLYDTDFFFQLAVYIFIGLVVGYSTERKNRLLEAKTDQVTVLEDKYSFLSEVYEDTRMVKAELQQQIMNNGDSFGKIYSVIKELESLEPEHIFTSTIHVVESIMKAKTVSIYSVNKYQSYLRLVARSNTDLPIDKSLKVEDHDYLRGLMKSQTVFMNRKLEAGIPLMAAPVLSKGEVIAVIELHDIEFEHFTMYYQNLLKIVADLISSTLTRAHSYVEATSGTRFIEGTSILKDEVFAGIVESKQAAKNRYGIEFILLSAGTSSSLSEESKSRIPSLLRETDYTGLGSDGELYVLLSNSSLTEAQFVLDRFSKNGISLRVVAEDEYYV
ncbi:NAD-dependent epimerase/dehydratase family protein [Paenibacillus turpanensis]|uniref:NAD-dependent epimerase/dehydratase family protein n=1 Tax=Paenibacillus turpanensis TaxID=2689078 RepID=UPI001409A3EB|nr:NAD-dependent epimerase/dehydratase family protein [Paenibacillus turpanensis]